MYYAVYDISNDRTRQRIVQTLKDAGFTRIQNSVFCGNLSSQQRKDFIEKTREVLVFDKDSLYLILTCNVCFGRVLMVGKGFDKEYVSDKRSSVVF